MSDEKVDETMYGSEEAAPVSDDYEKIFGDGGEVTQLAEDEEISFDPTEAGAGRLVKGRYVAAVGEVPVKLVSQNGNPMMKVVFHVVEGEYLGATISRRYMLSGKGGGWTKEFLKAVGATEEAEGRKPIRAGDLVDRKCWISVRPQKDDSEWNEVWRVEAYEDAPF